VVGQTLGSYRIQSELGLGGMGAVYLAEHRHLGRKAAVKVLRKEFANRPDLLERFFAEARATSMIEHPGIVNIFDCEVDGTGQPYIVMEYLAGETLGAHLGRRGPLPHLDALTIARRIADALGAAHAKGIVHRDLKPDNVFVLEMPPGAIKLVDFGIAKLTAAFQAGGMSRTQTGALMGTPLYMSPEQCRGAGSVDQRTDIYSLGCLLFEMLSGRPPFDYGGLGELVAAHITQMPPDVREFAPRVPDQVAFAVADLLKKDPNERPQSMRDVVVKLRALGAPSIPPDSLRLSGPIAASPTLERAGPQRAPQTTMRSSVGELDAWVDRPRVRQSRRWPQVLVGAALLAAAAVGAVTFLVPPGPASQPPAEALSGTAEPAPPGERAETDETPPATADTETPSSPTRALATEPPPVEESPPPVRAPTAVARSSEGPEPSAKPDRNSGERRGSGANDSRNVRRRAGGPRPAPVASTPAVSQAPTRVIVDSQPSGAEICAVTDRRLLGYTSTTLQPPADPSLAVYFVRYPGYRLERIAITPGRDTRRFVALSPLGPDELEPPSPCRRQ